MNENELTLFTDNLESVLVELIFDEAQGTEIDLSDNRVRAAIVNAFSNAAETFDCSDEEWKEMME
tara:strand:+ start:119 stop:313 length:195 start_codon:yes stop_codon:yes gene_type:complete